ncbi:DNA primase large subunit-like [Halichondria panicea]|uniref:DNA primase large subunit-like n=1 Tax=Halichondria panicea TaxID=6063 RepID=UPI00312B8B95
MRFRELLGFSERAEFFNSYKDDFNFDVVSREVSELKDEELNFYRDSPDSFYIVPFADALDLVQSRQVVIKSGAVYISVNNEEMIARLVCNKFRQKLSEELVKTRNHLPVVDDDERIAPMLKTIKHRYLGEDFSSVGENLQGSISLAQIDFRRFVCLEAVLSSLYETLRKEHHLRHFGRLQYGLFLKSIGLTLDQAMAFWRAEFVKKMEPEKFEKQYAYNVRHSYGKEGKRANYTPYSCLKIILSNNPGQGDHHGCPFRHWDDSHIRQMLTTHGVSHKGVTNITAYLKDDHYQLACQKYYEITHAIEAAPFSLEHPSQYFRESRMQRGHTGGKQETRLPTVKTEVKAEDDFCGDISIQDMQNFEEEMDQF